MPLPPSLSPTPLRSPRLQPWALLLPIVSILSYSIAFCCLRAQPAVIEMVLAQLAPLALLPLMPSYWNADAGLRRQVALLGVWLIWTSVVTALHPSHAYIGLSWLGTEAAAIALFITVCVSTGEADQAILVAAVSAGLSVLVSAAAIHTTALDAFGFGNINYLLSICDPPVWAGLLFLLHRTWSGRRLPWVASVVILLSAAALLHLALSCPMGIRRGSLLAGLVALAVVGWERGRSRWPRAVLPAVGVAAVVSVLVAMRIHLLPRLLDYLHNPVPSIRLDRLDIYRSAWERITETWMLGGGPYGALGIHDSAGAMASHWTAVGHWILHAHNELLEALLDGGIISGVLWLVLAVLGIRRACAVADPSQRVAMLALVGAIGVHAMTDNTYGTCAGRICLGAMLGLVYLAPTRVPAPGISAPWTPAWLDRLSLPSPRLALWPLAVLAAWSATREMSAAFADFEAFSSVRLRSLLVSHNPQVMTDEFEASFQSMFEDNDLPSCARALDCVTTRLGSFGPILYARAHLTQRTLLVADTSPSYRERIGEPAVRRLVPSAVDAEVALLETYRFHSVGYLELSQLLTRDPSCLPRVPTAMSGRLAYLTGPGTLPEPSLVGDPVGLEQAVDRFAALSWWLRTGHPLTRAQSAIVQLVTHYGDVPEVAELGMMLISRQDPQHAAALIDQLAPAMSLGFVYYTSPANQATMMGRLCDSGEVTSVAGVLRRLYPVWWSDFQRGRMTQVPQVSQEPEARDACLGVFGRERSLTLSPQR